MPAYLRMPDLPRGPRRDFVQALFTLYRWAGRPPLRNIVDQIQPVARDRSGTASHETIRRTLLGKSIPTWPTVETIAATLCEIANRDLDAPFYDDDYGNDTRGPIEVIKDLWNEAIDSPPPPPPRPRETFEDPWATPSAKTKFDEEPPF